jgi:hypothetical protein
MLITLPAFLAIGFGLGYLWAASGVRMIARSNTTGRFTRSVTSHDILVWLPWAALALVAFAILTAPLTTTGRMLAFAGIVVGALAGDWFQQPTGSRDKLFFLTGAGAFLFLAALEYDNKLFRNLSKIGGSEFSVEFSDMSRNQNNESRSSLPSANAENYSTISFPGASNIDFAISTMIDLPNAIHRDEQYYHLLSGQNIDSPDLFNKLPKVTELFYAYYCSRIIPIVNNINAMHSIQRSETSALSIDQRLIEILRTMYFRARIWSIARGSLNFPLAASERDVIGESGSRTKLKELLLLENDLLLQELDVFKSSTKTFAPDATNDGCSMLYDGPSDSIKQRVGQPLPFASVDSDSNNTIGFFSYLAATLALVEFGSGARESAVHFLENSMLTRVLNNEIDSVRIARLMDTVEDYDELFGIFDPKRERQASLFRSTFGDTSSAKCSPDVSSLGKDAESLFGRLVYTDLNVKITVLDYVGKNPSFVNARPDLVRKLDSFAQDVSTFDIDCMRRLKANFSKESPEFFESRNLDSLGAYWAAKGGNFDASRNDKAKVRGVELDREARVKALCSAKEAYSRALELAVSADENLESRRGEQRTPQSEVEAYLGSDKLDVDLKAAEFSSFPYAVQQRLDLVGQELNEFPAGDLPPSCR